LLLSAILTVFQIQDASDDPLTRTAALCSLISALMSLSYGIMYIIRFGSMRSMYHASRWAEEAQKTETAIFWNVWVLLALPGIWLAWSMLAFLVAIMSYVWRTGARGESQSPLSPGREYIPRIGITCQLLLGLVYMALVVRTFRSYGETVRKERVVKRLADIELETRARAREGEGEREGESTVGAAGTGKMPAKESEPEGLSVDGGEKGLAEESGTDRKQEVVGGNGDVSSDSDSSIFGM